MKFYKELVHVIDKLQWNFQSYTSKTRMQMRPNYYVSRQKTRFFKFWVPKIFSIFMIF